MTCSVCGLFGGNPCRLCRTHKRIRELLCGGLLLRGQEEEEALAILRTAAGALLDLAESDRTRTPLALQKTLGVEQH